MKPLLLNGVHRSIMICISFKKNFPGHVTCNGASVANAAPMGFGTCQGIPRMGFCFEWPWYGNYEMFGGCLGHGVISMPGVQINAHRVWRASSPV